MKKIYLLASLAILASSLSGQTDWVKHPDNPVLEPGVEGEWDEGFLNGGSVIFYNDTFRTWYSKGYPATTDPYIGYATSTDGVHWTKYGDNPVLVSGSVESWDGYKVVFPTVLIRDMVYHMWYIGQPHGSDFHEYKIGHATSTDGIHWEKDPQNPVLEKGPGGSPDANYIFIISAVHDDSLFHLWYSANNNVDDYLYTCHATSQDGTVWSKDPENPVLTGGSWDSPMLNPGPVLYDGSDFHMWYMGGEPTNRRVGYATSTDGTVWVKPSDNPVLTGGQPGDWDEGDAVAKGIVYDSTLRKYKMWYSAGAKGVGYAETYEPAWKQMESMDMERGTPSSAVIDQMIYVFGGMDQDNATLSSARAYNTSTNEWSVLENMPQDLFGGPAAAVNSKIYVIGGYSNDNGNWIPLNSTLEYDPDGDVWQAKTNFPETKAGMSSCVLNDTLYILGGNAQNAKKAWYYVPEKDNWHTLPDMIYSRPATSKAVAMDNKIYVIGGTFELGLENPTGKSEMYDPQSKAWTELADMPVRVGPATIVVYDQKILVFGGNSTRTADGAAISTNFIQSYDPSTDSWKLMKGMPFERAGMGGGKVDGFVYLIGGYLDSWENPFSEVWRFNLDSLEEWEVPCQEVILNETSLELNADASATLTATVLPEYAADRTVSWSSSDDAFATVSAEGEVTAVSGGTVTITASSNAGKCTASCEVTVLIPVIGVSLDLQTLEMENGQTATLVATISPPDATDPMVNWWSGNDAVATVNENGEVTANSVDSTYIYVSTNDGGYMDSCQVTVTFVDGVMQSQAKNMISIYPNPVSEFLNIHSGSMGIYRVDISSISGQVLQSFKLDQTIFQLDLSSFASGFYFITIRSKDFVTTRKIVKL